MAGKKSFGEAKKQCGTCGAMVTGKTHECFRTFCENHNQHREIGHLCYMKPLQNVLPRSEKVLFVFYDFETTQEDRYSEKATQHKVNLAGLQQFCSKCETIPDIDVECDRYGLRKHSFFEDPVGAMLAYLCEPRPGVTKIVAIAHKASGFDINFILNRIAVLKWRPEIINNGLKIFSMKVQHMHFIYSVSYLPMPLRQLPKPFGLSVKKSYPHYFNTSANMNYVGGIPYTLYYGADSMSEEERQEFLEWYDLQKDKLFYNKRVLEVYSHDDVSVFREACQRFRGEYM